MIHVPISTGELYDKITILEIKKDKLKGTPLYKHVDTELSLLEAKTLSIRNKPSKVLIEGLREVNLMLWGFEDAIREEELRKDFGKLFVELARRIYKTNDERSRLKAQINNECDSGIIEVKSYHEY